MIEARNEAAREGVGGTPTGHGPNVAEQPAANGSTAAEPPASWDDLAAMVKQLTVRFESIRAEVCSRDRELQQGLIALFGLGPRATTEDILHVARGAAEDACGLARVAAALGVDEGSTADAIVAAANRLVGARPGAL